MFPNKFIGVCNNPACKKSVAVSAGYITKVNNKWLTWCSQCVPVQKGSAPANKRVLTADGFILIPGYEPDSVTLIKTLKGPQGSPWPKYNGDMKAWEVSTEQADRARLLEVAERLKLEVAPQLREVVLTESAKTALAAGLYDFQVDGVNWMSKRQKALLGDDMGLGKTIMTLQALPKNGKGLVVAPAGLKYNWKKEAAIWRPDLKVTVLEHRGSFRFPVDGELVITNYDILPDFLDPNPAPVRVVQLAGGKTKKHRGKRPKIKWVQLKEWREKLAKAGTEAAGVTVIFDEAHKLKNYKTDRSIKSRELACLCVAQQGRVWGLTGTPFDNKPEDLYGVLDSLGMTFDVFTPGKGQSPFKRFQELFNAEFDGYGTRYGNPAPIVPELLRRVMLRRRRTEVLPNLPRKTYSNLVVGEIDAKLQRQLDDMWDDIGVQLTVEEKLPPFEKFSEMRAKLAKANIPAMLEYVEECEEQDVPLVVFSAHLAPIDALLGRPGWACISGDTSPEKRQEIVDAFQAGRLRGVALTIRAGGVGLTLTRAWKALFVDLDWVPGWNAQAEDRICRIGQNASKVEIVRMVNDHPLTIHVLNLLAEKAALIEKAVEKMMIVNTRTEAKPGVHGLPGWGKDEETIAEFEDRMAAIKKAQEDLEKANSVLSAAEAKAKAKGKVDMIHGREKAKNTRPILALTPARTLAVRDAFRHMLSVCDGANAKDFQGFNRPDAVVGHCLLTAGLETNQEVEAAYYILARYFRQLSDKFPILFGN